MDISPFHLAIPVHDIDAARKFYGRDLGCIEGRSAEHWIDYNFFGHQLVVHLNPNMKAETPSSSTVDSLDVPIPHFGVVIPWEEWDSLVTRLRNNGITFLVEPGLRFKGLPGEQSTMFFKDPSGNAIEFKSFKDISNLFAS